MKHKTNIVVSISAPGQFSRLPEIPDAVGLIELRADLLPDPYAIKNFTHKPAVYVLRSKSAGGTFDGAKDERHHRLAQASRLFDFVELEADQDLTPELFQIIPASKRRISWYGWAETYDALHERISHYMQTPASCYKIVVNSNEAGQEIPAVRLLKSKLAEKGNLITFAVGPGAAWTQILAPFLGAQEVHAKWGDLGKDDAFFSIDTLMRDYGLPRVYPVENLFGIVGNPVYGSISPGTHNEAYRQLKLPYLYLPFQTENFRSFIEHIANNPALPVPLSGLTVVAPFKMQCERLAGDHKILHGPFDSAYNGITRKKEGWFPFSTDAIGAINALNALAPDWQKKRIALIGCGGTGRTIAEAIKLPGVDLTLVNRNVDRGLRLAKHLGLRFLELENFDVKAFEVIIHATPLGKKTGTVPFDVTRLNQDSIVIDHVYSQGQDTDLIRYCRLWNISCVDGKEIAQLQIKYQFKFLTDCEMQSRNKLVSQTLNEI